jgi:hypothetical protein
MNKRNDTPVYQKLVATVRSGFLVLDATVQKEILFFIKSQQDGKGGFVDRAGMPDLYYSLFGLWLSMATEQIEIQNKLKNYVSDINISDSKSPVEDLALLLIKSELDSNSKERSVSSIIKMVFKKGRTIELSYQFFLISLAIDAVGRNKRRYNFFARICLFFYKPKGTIPCSLNAALVYAIKMLGLNARSMPKKLEAFLLKTGGFKAFETVETADSLSTGVALFVMKETAYDMRVIAPACLDFIQDNYSGGAFLSGDGDQTKDLEYTFYGLLALGSLIK